MGVCAQMSQKRGVATRIGDDVCDDLYEANGEGWQRRTSRCQCPIVMATYIVVGWMIMEERKDDGGCGRDVFFVARTNNLSFPSFPNPIHPTHANCLCIWDPWFVRWLGLEKDGAGP